MMGDKIEPDKPEVEIPVEPFDPDNPEHTTLVQEAEDHGC